MIPIASAFANAAIGQEETILRDIHIPSKNIAIYQRDIGHLEGALAQIAEQTVEFKASGTVKEVLLQLEEGLNGSLSAYAFLLEDISKLLHLFERTAQAASYRLLLATVRTNMCRKFHTDVNDLRLLCTYTGPGTLWIPDELVNQKATPAKTEGQVQQLGEAQIQRVRTGEVAILKGALYMDANPILHRSPTIEESGQTRLLLRIDTNEFLSFLK